MPDANVAKTLIRVFDLLRLLPRHGAGKTAGAMHEELLRRGYEIEKRTVERDLRMLQSAFPEYLGCEDKTKPFGWHWLPGKELCITNIQPGEALLLELVAQSLHATLPAPLLEPLAPRFAQARATLHEQELPGAGAPLHEALVAYLGSTKGEAPGIEQSLLDEITSALLANEQIEVSLPSEQGTEPEPTRVALTPVALLQHESVTHLIAFRAGSPTPEHFALHRLQQAVRLPRRGEILPQSFALNQYVASLAETPLKAPHLAHTISLQAHISDKLRRALLDTPLVADQSMVREGDAWRLQATVATGDWLISWILRHGAEIRIDQPPELRTAVRTEIDKMAQAYTHNPG